MDPTLRLSNGEAKGAHNTMTYFVEVGGAPQHLDDKLHSKIDACVELRHCSLHAGMDTHTKRFSGADGWLRFNIDDGRTLHCLGLGDHDYTCCNKLGKVMIWQSRARGRARTHRSRLLLT